MENDGSFDFCFSVLPNEGFRQNPLIVVFFNLKTFSGIRGLAYFSDDVPV